jgi:hypothetical protein
MAAAVMLIGLVAVTDFAVGDASVATVGPEDIARSATDEENALDVQARHTHHPDGGRP